MGLRTKAKNLKEANPGIEQEEKDFWYVDVLGEDGKTYEQYEVTDGDSLKAVKAGSDGERKQLRVKGHTAPETEKLYSQFVKPGQRGGEHGKRALLESLKANKFQIGSSQLQTVGGGAGKRYVTEFKNAESGEDLYQFMLTQGVATSGSFSSQQDRDAELVGQLNREIFGEQSSDAVFDNLRETKPSAYAGGFKTKADSKSDYQNLKTSGRSKWFNGSISDFIHAGSSFEQRDTDREGYSNSPISTGFANGLNYAAADIGAAVSLLGEFTDSEWAKQWGDRVAYIQGQKAEDRADVRIQRLADIGQNSDTYGEYLGNTASWLLTNTAQSVPYLGVILGGTIAGTYGAAALGAGAVAGTVAGLAPSALIHAGEVWGNVDKYVVDPETGEYKVDENGEFINNRNDKTASVAVVAGIAAASLDRLGLAGVLKPSQLLTAAGSRIAAKRIAARDGVPYAAALATVNQTTKKVTGETLEAVSKAAASESSKITGFLRSLGTAAATASTAAASEAITEAGQELTTYITAKGINNEAVSVDEILGLFKDDPQIRELLIESAAAGAGVGGAFNVVGQSYSAARDLREKAWQAESNPFKELGSFRSYAETLNQTFRDKGLGSIAAINESNGNRVIRQQASSGFETTDGSGYETGLFNTLVEEDSKSGATQRVKEGISTVGHEASAGIADLVLTPLDRFTGIDKIKAAPTAFAVYSTFTGIRATIPGQTLEGRYDTNVGVLNQALSEKTVGQRHGFNHSSDRAQTAFSDKFYIFADEFIKHKKNLNNLQKDSESVKALEEAGVTLAELNDYRKTYQETTAHGNGVYQIRKDAYNNNLDPNDPRVKFANEVYLKDWGVRHRDLDPESIAANRPVFEAAVVNRVNQIRNNDPKNANLQKIFRAPTAYAKNLADNILTGAPLDPTFSLISEHSQVSGVDKRSRTLSLSDDPAFKEFQSRNLFATHKRARESTVREATFLDYIGDKGSKLDVMFSDIRNELRENTTMSDAEINSYLGQFAGRLKSVLDSTTGNYNRIQNETLANTQENILTYTSLLGMSLAFFASWPETAAIGVGLRSSAEFKKLTFNAAKELFGGIKRSVINVKSQPFVGSSAENNKKVEDTFFDLQMAVGIPQDQAALTRRLGATESEGVLPSKRRRQLLDVFFQITLLKGLTSVQRSIGTATSLDFIKNRVMVLYDVDLDGKLNRDQHDAYSALSQLGVDVRELVKQVKSRADGETEGSSTSILDEQFKKLETYGKRDALQEQLSTAIQNFVNTRIQNPRASNRPLVVQDPRFKLFTQFNSFLATVTNVLLPQIWNDQIGRAIRTKNPGLSYEIMGVALAMLILGAAGQWSKDELKYGESSPYLEEWDRYLQRIIASSGLLGQAEKGLELIHPLYPQQGEGIGGRLVDTLLGSGGRQADLVTDLLTPSRDEGTKDEEFYQDLVKFIPVLNTFTVTRQDLAKQFAGTGGS